MVFSQLQEAHCAVTYGGHHSSTQLGTDRFFGEWGFLTVDGGSSATLDNLYVGMHSSGSLLVSGHDSTLNVNNGYVNQGWFLIGFYSSQGHATIEQGGKIIANGKATIGYSGELEAPHHLTIRDSNSQLIANSLSVATKGAGRITLSNNASLEINSDSHIGEELLYEGDIFTPAKVGFGEITVGHNTTFRTGGTLYVGNDTGSGSTWKAADGHLHIYPGSLVEANNIVRHANRGHINWHGGIVRIRGGNTSAFHDGSGNLHLGSTDGQFLELPSRSAASSTDVVVGHLAGQQATITITGDSNTSSSSYVETIQTATSDYHVGASGSGQVYLNNGRINVQGYELTLGASAGSSGTLIAAGPKAIIDLTRSSARLTIGSKGTGYLSLTGGASASTAEAYIGRDTGAGSGGTLVIEDGSLTCSRELYVGRKGRGTLHVTSLGTIQSGGAYIDSTSTETSSVTFHGVGSSWTNRGDLQIGKNGEGGALNISGAATVDNTGGTIYILDKGVITNYAGTIIADQINIEPGASLLNNVDIKSPVSNEGALTSSNTSGLPNFYENVTNKSEFSGNGRFRKNLIFESNSVWRPRMEGAAMITQYDHLQVDGLLQLAGTLEITFTNGHVPVAGSSFQLWSCQTVAGEFTTLSLPSLPAGLHWHKEDLYTTGFIHVGLTPENYSSFSRYHSLAGTAMQNDDGDEILNIFEYVGGKNPQQPDQDGSSLPNITSQEDGSLSFNIAQPIGGDVILEVQASSTMADDDWVIVATKTGSGDWTGPASVQTNKNNDGTSRISVTASGSATHLFYRLKASLTP